MEKEDLKNLPTSREEAIALGEVFYYTGIPCKKGHLSKRYTTSGQCVECVRETHLAKAARIKDGRAKRNSGVDSLKTLVTS